MFKSLIFVFSFIVIFFSSFFSFNVYSKDALDDVFNNNDNQIIKNDISNNPTQVSSWIQKSTKLMLKIAITIGIAVFLVGGIRFFLSMGDDSKAKKVRDSLITAAIGFVIAFGAWAILQIMVSIGNTIGNNIGG